MRTTRSIVLASASALVALGALGCESIIGLRDLEGQGSEPSPPAHAPPPATPLPAPPAIPSPVLVDAGVGEAARLSLVLPHALALGSTHSCALDRSGVARCWGGNAAGQLGADAPPISEEARAVRGVPRAVALAAGPGHTCAIASDGKVLCWGRGDRGQLGGAPARPGATVTVPLQGLAARQIAAGALHTCALLADTSVRCWGDDAQGQLGIGDRREATSPVTPIGLQVGVAAIFAAGFYTCALEENGALVCWGDNAFGQLGDRTKTNRPAPVAVRDLTESIRDVALGQSTACAVLASGAVQCWGRNRPLGDPRGMGIVAPQPDAPPETTSPSTVNGLPLARTMAVGATHACARTLADRAVCWGSNARLQLATEPDGGAPVPGFVDVSALGGAVREIAVGLSHACALASNDEIFCWGNDEQGQLGTPAGAPRAKPERVRIGKSEGS